MMGIRKIKTEGGYADEGEKVGYAGTAYHAWISVYIKDIGWIDNIIQFDGKNWSFMDPTVAANKDNSEEMKKLIGDGTTYTVQYHY